MQVVKCVVVGDVGVGKKSLIQAVSQGNGHIRTDAPPSSADDKESINLDMYGKPLTLHVYAVGSDCSDNLRPLTYPQTDVFVICFSISSHSSFAAIKSKWIPEINHHCPHTPKLLVGLQSESREDTEVETTFITKEQGEALASELQCVEYLECSALTNRDSCRQVFFNATKCLITTPEHFAQRRRNDRCNIKFCTIDPRTGTVQTVDHLPINLQFANAETQLVLTEAGSASQIHFLANYTSDVNSSGYLFHVPLSNPFALSHYQVKAPQSWWGPPVALCLTN